MAISGRAISRRYEVFGSRIPAAYLILPDTFQDFPVTDLLGIPRFQLSKQDNFGLPSLVNPHLADSHYLRFEKF